MSPVNETSSSGNFLSVRVTEEWLNDFSEQVGSLVVVLTALSKLDDFRPHTLVSEALDNCAALQELLNTLPVSGGQVPALLVAAAAHQWQQPEIGQIDGPVQPELSSPWVPLALGDSFPEFQANQEDELPAIDAVRLEEKWNHDVARVLEAVQRFRARAEGDLRELQMLSVGHDWARLARLAGVLKDAAVQVSATRIVVDAAALEAAARVGCRHDVDLTLDALKADLRACTKQADEWPAIGVVG